MNDVSPRRPVDWRIWLLALGTFAIGTDAFVIAGILPSISRDLRISLEAGGQIVTAYAVTYGLSSPFIAAATARFRRGPLVAIALAIFAFANAACALAPSYGALMAARFLAGLAAALYTPAAYALAAASAAPGQRGAALATVSSGLTIATVLGVPLGVATGIALGWHATFWLITVLSVFAAVILGIRPVEAQLQQSAPVGLRERLAPLSRPSTLMILLPCYLWSTGSFAVYTYLAAFFQAAGYGAHAIVILLLAYGVGGVLGNYSGGRLTDRFGWSKPIGICLAVLAGNQFLLPWTATLLPAAATSLFLWAFAGWITWPSQQARLMAHEPEAGNVVLALSNSIVYLASASGAALGAVLIPLMTILWLPFAGGTLYTLAFIVFVFGRRAPRH